MGRFPLSGVSHWRNERRLKYNSNVQEIHLRRLKRYELSNEWLISLLHVYPQASLQYPYPVTWHQAPVPSLQVSAGSAQPCHSHSLYISASHSKRNIPLITEGFSLTFWARSDCFIGGVLAARAAAIAFPTAISTFGGGATSFSRSIFVRCCPSVLCAARVFDPATNFFSVWRVPERAAAFIPDFDFTVVGRVEFTL